MPVDRRHGNILIPALLRHGPQTVTIQAVYNGSAGPTQLFNDVWKSTDGGATWVNVHANP